MGLIQNNQFRLEQANKTKSLEATEIVYLSWNESSYGPNRFLCEYNQLQPQLARWIVDRWKWIRFLEIRF